MDIEFKINEKFTKNLSFYIKPDRMGTVFGMTSLILSDSNKLKILRSIAYLHIECNRPELAPVNDTVLRAAKDELVDAISHAGVNLGPNTLPHYVPTNTPYITNDWFTITFVKPQE